MLRSGPNRSQLIVEDGVRHQCCYDVGLGPMMIGISGEGVASTLTDGGGDLKFRYSMDMMKPPSLPNMKYPLTSRSVQNR